MGTLGRSKPSRPNHNKDRIRFCQLLLNVHPKVRPKRNAVHVYKNGIFSEVGGKPIANASGKYIRVRPAV